MKYSVDLNKNFDIEKFHSTFMLDHKTFTVRSNISRVIWLLPFFFSLFFSSSCLTLGDNKPGLLNGLGV